jgi:nucleotide-binding universal stress UspA family protein
MEAAMDYRTLMVHLELSGDNEGILKIAGDLAERFKAKVIGIAAAQPIKILYDEACTAGEIIAEDRAEIEKELSACRAQFREALEGRANGLEWRPAVTFDSLDGYIADQARVADLIITGKDIGGGVMDTTRRVNIGRLAVMAGRPILLVPQGITSLPLANVFIAWKDTREARRAALDALPLLEAAGHATVLEVASVQDQAEADKRVKDVALWLERHRLSATRLAIGTSHAQEGFLRSELGKRHCDLLVAGAFSHNRMGEWFFGGMTEDLLLDPDCCVLLSH